VIPIGLAAAAGWWVWRNWDGKFGRIRLGGDSGPGFSALGDGRTQQSLWIEWPVAIVSGVVAVVAATPLLLGSLWKSGRNMLGFEGRGFYSGLNGGTYGRTYTSRSSFARNRADVVVDEDEGELLGEDSDEEV
jgi:hypothetical protein